MGLQNNDDEKNNENGHKNHRFQFMYARMMRERQVFMENLKQCRQKSEKKKMKQVHKMVGPVWYQVLSVAQLNVLDNIKHSMRQDLIEGRPIRVAKDIRDLGIYPKPNGIDLLNCVFIGRDDPAEMLALLFHEIFGYPVTMKQSSYPLNARLILTGIFYIGLQKMIYSLDDIFRNDVKYSKQTRPPIKRKSSQITSSPYLQEMVVKVHTKPKRKRFLPPPIPSLDLNGEDEGSINEYPVTKQRLSTQSKQQLSTSRLQDTGAPLKRPSVQQLSQSQIQTGPSPGIKLNLPPIPQLKRKVPRSLCDKLAGIYRIKPDASDLITRTISNDIMKKRRKSHFNFEEVKKSFGMSEEKKKKICDPPQSLPLMMPNIKYTINGIAIVNGRAVYILDTVTIIPVDGNLINGGIAIVNDMTITLNLGYAANPPPPKCKPCDCIEKWNDTVFKYIEDSKCKCGHGYDFHNEGKFPPEEVPFFHKPTPYRKFHFDYNAIFETDKRTLHIAKEFKRIWETDSILRGGVPEPEVKKPKKITSFGKEALPEDYLKHAMKSLHTRHKAASLPDVDQAPELREWMRRRIYGPVTNKEKAQLKYKSNIFWQMFATLANHGYGHVNLPKEPEFSGNSDWLHQSSLREKFEHFSQDYKNQFFQAQASLNNLLWPTMFQSIMPDKHFRETYFSYLQAKIDDVQLFHPYNTRESLDRRLIMQAKK